MEKTYTKPNGAKIVIDGAVCYIDTPKGRAMVGGEDGHRYSYTLSDDRIKLPEAIARKAKCDRGVYIYIAGNIGTCTVDDNLLAWLRDNWPVSKTELDMWEDICPECAMQMKAYNRAWAAYHDEVERRMEDESLSFIPPAKPTIEKPVLTADGAAWLKLDDMQYASNYAKAGAAKRAIKGATDGSMSLTDAYAQADKEWSDYCDKHMWD